MAQHGEGDGDDGEVRPLDRPARLRPNVHSHAIGILVEGVHLDAQPDLLLERPEERGRQAIHAAGDLLHVHVGAAQLLAEHLDQRVVHVRFEEVHDREVLDGPTRPAAVAEVLVERELVVLAHDVVPGGVALPLDHLAQLADGLLPQLLGGPTALRLRQLEAEARGVGVGLPRRHAHAADMHQPLGVPITKGRIGSPKSWQ